MRLLERLGARSAGPDAPPLELATASATSRHAVLVKVFGALDGAEALGAALPSGWTFDHRDNRIHPLTDLIVIVVLAGILAPADAALVARVRSEHPGEPLLAIVPAMADSAGVVAALEAGADACVRTASAPVVASHLLSMQRRRELERVNRFQDADLTST
jgi:hypothetical protein